MDTAMWVSSVHTHGGVGSSRCRTSSGGAEKKHWPNASPTDSPSRASRAFSSAMADMQIESINAVTLAVHDMSRSVRFYTALGFSVRYGGEQAPFTSLHAGSRHLNLIAPPADRRWARWGRGISAGSHVAACHRPSLAQGLRPAT